MKKLIAIVLALSLLFATAIPGLAAVTVQEDTFEGYSSSETIENTFNYVIDRLIHFIVKILNFFLPGYNWTDRFPNYDDYETENFYAGEETFSDEVTAESVWSMGYADGSLLDGLDIMNGEYYMAGSLEITEGRVPSVLLDDQKVYTYAVSDGVSGTVVHAVIDGFGIARGDVQEIRSRLADFAEENDIIAINVSVLHQHSCIDTFGMAAPILSALVNNPGATLFKGEVISGRNETFMENLYNVTVKTVKDAVNSMTEGRLYYGSVDVGEFMYDKREPIVYDNEMHRFRFVPTDETKNEIWLVQGSIHCVGFGAGGDILTSDYPYYMKQYIKDTYGADTVYVMGAELAITDDYSTLVYEDTATDSGVKAYGYALGKRVGSIAAENEIELQPVLNIAMREMTVSADNQILILAVREGLLNSRLTKKGLDYVLYTEMGYMELGGKVGIVIAPGEVAPEILYGGACCEERSWTGESWDYAPLIETAKVENLLCFGLCNDQIGYIFTDNDYRSLLTENEEVNACSWHAASTLVKALETLIDEVK